MSTEREINTELREHVTRVGFDMNLSKTQIGALIYLHLMIQGNKDFGKRHMPRNQMGSIARMVDSNFVMGINGCMRRGLVIHHFTEREKDHRGLFIGPELPVSSHYTITTAGRFVIGLLKEAGIYQDYAGPIALELIPELVSV